MSKKLTKKEIFSIPNLLSYFRIILIPVFIAAYLSNQYFIAVAALLVSGLSDIADGYIARKYHMITDLGKLIDPVADKMTQAAMVICVAFSRHYALILFYMLAFKELSMLALGYVLYRRTGVVYSAKWFGKVCTFIMYSSLLTLIIWADIPQAVALTLICLCSAALIAAFILYAVFFIRMLSKKHA